MDVISESLVLCEENLLVYSWFPVRQASNADVTISLLLVSTICWKTVWLLVTLMGRHGNTKTDLVSSISMASRSSKTNVLLPELGDRWTYSLTSKIVGDSISYANSFVKIFRLYFILSLSKTDSNEAQKHTATRDRVHDSRKMMYSQR